MPFRFALSLCWMVFTQLCDNEIVTEFCILIDDVLSTIRAMRSWPHCPWVPLLVAFQHLVFNFYPFSSSAVSSAPTISSSSPCGNLAPMIWVFEIWDDIRVHLLRRKAGKLSKYRVIAVCPHPRPFSGDCIYNITIVYIFFKLANIFERLILR
jgi:hypothetical protein